MAVPSAPASAPAARVRILRAGGRAREFGRGLIIPLVAVLLFLAVWSRVSASLETALGRVPGPVAVLQQARALWIDHRAERARAEAFYERQASRNASIRQQNPTAAIVVAAYTGKPTFIDQIATSLKTVFAGFLLASGVAIPLGILCGVSYTINAAMNPFIQVFRPVSPLAWLPIITLVVSAVYVSPDPMLEKSFINSALTVALCSLWPTVINTAYGVSSIDRDLLNVARMLRLTWTTKLTKVLVPAALPLIFTGLRLSLGVGWMVLIAAEMLAQNPGLGKFVWDEFQNGSSDSLSRIMVAVFTIGGIGFVLDRLMLSVQRLVDLGSRR